MAEGVSEQGAGRQVVLTLGQEAYGTWYRQTYHAFKSFLGAPLGLALLFLLLGILLYALERTETGWLQPVRDLLSRHIFANSDMTGSFLDTVAGGFLTMTSIMLLLAFLYTTIEQMRPETIIRDIHRSTLESQQWQLSFARRTRRSPQVSGGTTVELRSKADGYVARLDVEHLSQVLAGAGPGVEVMLHAAPGTFVAYYDLVAEVRAPDTEARELAESVGHAFRFASKREMKQDPAYGLEQLEMVAWTEVSSAKQNPEVGLRAIHSLRDLLSRWLMQDPEVESREPLPVVYNDGLLFDALDVLESLGAATFESHQHQVLAEVLRTVDVLFDRFPPELAGRAGDIVLRLLPHLEGQVLSRELDAALFDVASRMERLGEVGAAEAVDDARLRQPGAMSVPVAAGRAAAERKHGSWRGPGFGDERS